MRRTVAHIVAVAAATSALTLLPAPSASATIHEIVGQWCAGKGELKPPGVQDGENFAKPVFANGFVGPTIPFDPPGAQLAGLLITFNYGIPASKVVGTGTYVAVGQTPAGPLYIEIIQLDPSFPAFQHCPRLSTP